MTYAPADLLEVRSYLVRTLDLHPNISTASDLEPNEVGIVGDPAHAATGGYHMGNYDLAAIGRLYTDYSKSESPRDRPGSNAASALDIGEFDVTRANTRTTLRSLSLEIVDACQRGDARVRDIREVIYTPDGSTVRRWDRLGIRSSGSSSHLFHTHISFFRDSENRRALMNNFMGLMVELIEEEEKEMLTLIRYTSDPAVFLTNGIIARWVTTPGEIADLGTLNATGRFNIPAGTDIQVVGRRELVGVIVGPCPPGWESQRMIPELTPSGEVPAQVELTPRAITEVEAAAFRGAQKAEGE